MDANTYLKWITFECKSTPYAFDAFCETTGRTTVRAQSQCATQILVNFVNELKRLRRFDDSLIIVHSDHGNILPSSNSQWIKARLRSHNSLLLIKPAGVAASEPLASNNSNVTLTDIVPGIRSFVRQQQGGAAEAIWWHSTGGRVGKRIRHFYSVVAEERMQRFTIQGQQLVAEEVIPIRVKTGAAENSLAVVPIVAINTVVESESGWLSTGVEVHTGLPDTQGSSVAYGTKSYRFYLPVRSRVQIEARAITPDGNSNSSLMRMNALTPKVWQMPFPNSWQWQVGETFWDLDKGMHKISLEYVEKFHLDQIRIMAVPLSEQIGPEVAE